MSRWTSWAPVPDKPVVSVDVLQSSGAVWKSRWTSWAPVPDKPTVSVDVKQHFSFSVALPSLSLGKALALLGQLGLL